MKKNSDFRSFTKSLKCKCTLTLPLSENCKNGISDDLLNDAQAELLDNLLCSQIASWAATVFSKECKQANLPALVIDCPCVSDFLATNIFHPDPCFYYTNKSSLFTSLFHSNSPASVNVVYDRYLDEYRTQFLEYPPSRNVFIFANYIDLSNLCYAVKLATTNGAKSFMFCYERFFEVSKGVSRPFYPKISIIETALNALEIQTVVSEHIDENNNRAYIIAC
jgi:hypothetical protein